MELAGGGRTNVRSALLYYPILIVICLGRLQPLGVRGESRRDDGRIRLSGEVYAKNGKTAPHCEISNKNADSYGARKKLSPCGDERLLDQLFRGQHAGDRLEFLAFPFDREDALVIRINDHPH